MRQEMINRYGFDPAIKFAGMTRDQLEQALAASNATVRQCEVEIDRLRGVKG